MEAEGLIKRVKDLQKRNLVRVSVTEKGKKLYNEISDTDSFRLLTSPLAQAERKQLCKSLQKLRNTALNRLMIDVPPWPKPR
jgi:DNA-binding MarR family transcriptional regulator